MGHLNFFGIDNFKLFKDLNRFEIKPITVLVGMNSSGKSSLSKGIYLPKSSFEKIDFVSSYSEDTTFVSTKEIEQLSFQSKDMYLGNFTNCVNNKSNNPYISFELPISFPPLQDLFMWRFVYTKSTNHLQNGELKEIKIIHSYTNTQILHFEQESLTLKINFSFLKEKLDYEISNSENFDENIQTNFNLIKFPFLFEEKYLRSMQNHLHINNDDLDNLVKICNGIKLKFSSKTDNIVEYLRQLEIESLDELLFQNIEDSDDGDFSYLLDNLFNEKKVRSNKSLHDTPLILSTIDKMIEKEPLLEDVEHLYSLMFEQNSFNILDSNINRNKRIDFSYFMKDFIYSGIEASLYKLKEAYTDTHFIPAVRGTTYLQEFLEKYRRTFPLERKNMSKQFINRFVQKFGVADSIEIIPEEYKGKSEMIIYLWKDGKNQKLADVGYGVTQILPIIIKLGELILGRKLNDKNWVSEEDFFENPILVIIEEPETNLHPALQSKLVDMFVECHEKYNIQFILETHSEYLIRKLQYLTAKKEFAAKDSVIYYFNDPNNIPEYEKQVKKIEILEDGSLSDDFGSGFFDEASNWELELLRIKRNKNRQN